MGYSGWNPFGPWTDLKDEYKKMADDLKHKFLKYLERYKEDSFWKDFIELFMNDLLEERKTKRKEPNPPRP